MAGKARRIRDSIKNYLAEDDEVKNAELLGDLCGDKKIVACRSG